MPQTFLTIEAALTVKLSATTSLFNQKTFIYLTVIGLFSLLPTYPPFQRFLLRLISFRSSPSVKLSTF